MIDDRVDVDEPNNAVSELSTALRRRVDRVGRFFLLMAVGLVVWVVYLAIKLPGRRLAVHYDIAWVGFDSGLAVALLLTGALVIKRSPARRPTSRRYCGAVAGRCVVRRRDGPWRRACGGHRVRGRGGAAAGGPLRDRCPSRDPAADR